MPRKPLDQQHSCLAAPPQRERRRDASARLALEERDRHAVATLVLLSRTPLLDPAMSREVIADRGAQRAGAVAMDDEHRLASCDDALVEEPIDLRDRLVGTVTAH